MNKNEGLIMDGCPFYFRARHGRWALTVAPVDGDAVDTSNGFTPSPYRATGDDPTDGYMLPEEVTRIIAEG